MRASAACDPMKFHDGPPVNAQDIVPLIWQSFSCNLRSKKCLRPLEMHLSVSHPVRYPMDMALQLLYHSTSCFASAQFVHEVRNRQLIGFSSLVLLSRRETRSANSLRMIVLP